jgi:hypothetical protein
MKPEPRPIHEIASEVWRTWRSKDGNQSVHYAALPYLRAMQDLNTIEDSYVHDTARSVVLYFLANARSWRGEDAKRIKAELKELAR